MHKQKKTLVLVFQLQLMCYIAVISFTVSNVISGTTQYFSKIKIREMVHNLH